MSVGDGFKMGCGALLAAGFVKLLGAALTIAGLIWIMGRGDPPASSAVRSEATTATHCGVMNGGSVDAAGNVREQGWSDYTCQARGTAGSQWGHCLRRSDYTEEAGAGCPGAQRCCPP